MILEIKKYPDSILRRKSEKVRVFDEKLRRLCAEMFETLKINKGLGLAAPQIGKSLSFFIVEFNDKRLIFINPEIIKKEGEEIFEEGCLSFPGLFLKIKRPKRIEVKYQDLDGQERKIKADGILARVIQHELDHLDGILFIDRLSWLKKISLIKKLKKMRA